MYQATESTPPLQRSVPSSPKGPPLPKADKKDKREKSLKTTKITQDGRQTPRLQSIAVDPIDPELNERIPLMREFPSSLPRGYNAGTIQPCCVLLYIATFLFAATLCYAIVAFTQTFACMGPPYIYVTHKGSKNVMKYSRDGCLIHEKVCIKEIFIMLRSVLFLYRTRCYGASTTSELTSAPWLLANITTKTPSSWLTPAEMTPVSWSLEHAFNLLVCDRSSLVLSPLSTRARCTPTASRSMSTITCTYHSRIPMWSCASIVTHSNQWQFLAT